MTGKELSIAGAITRYVRDRSTRGELGPNTVPTVRGVLRPFGRTVGVSRPIAKLDRRLVRRWWEALEVSPSSKRAYLSMVRTFCRWCVERGLLKSDPTGGILSPAVPQRIPRPLDEDEVSALIETCETTRDLAIVLLMVHCGLRSVEISRMQMGDIDYRGRIIVVHGKGARDRPLPIPEEAWEALVAYLSEHPAANGPLFRRFDQSYVALKRRTIIALLRRKMAQAGLKTGPWDGVAGHALRRTCATDLLEAGANIREVQAVLGHTQMSSTQRYLRWQEARQLRPIVEGRHYQRRAA
jgi:site-specific recombinase XerD